MWTARRVIISALQDGLDWQLSLADAHKGCRDENEQRARDMAERYRVLLDRLTGDRRTSLEKLLSGSTPISLENLRKRD